MGFFDAMKKTVKRSYSKWKADEERKDSIYKEAYRKAEIGEIRKKARRDARKDYEPVKPKNRKKKEFDIGYFEI